MKILKRNGGQFVPMTAMVMFSMVMFLIAVVNIYKVTRAKLKVQNLADAAALNLAAQEAQAFNTVADRNEWMNYMDASAPNPTAGAFATAPGANPCAGANNPSVVPGISCAENTGPHDGGNIATWPPSQVQLLQQYHVFNSSIGVQNYASLVKTVNDAQKLLVDAYNTFLGARTGGGQGNSTSAGSMQELLKNDIPELRDDPTIHLYVFNDPGGQSQADLKVSEKMADKPAPLPTSGPAHIQSMGMKELGFKVKNDLEVRYYQETCLLGVCTPQNYSKKTYLGQSLIGPPSGTPGPQATPADYVGYMEPDNMPRIEVPDPKSSGKKSRVGVGVSVVKYVNLPGLGAYPVQAKSKAYVVEGSGVTGERDSNNIPIFKPTYWVKLAN